MCDRCNDLTKKIEIRYPKELRYLLAMVKDKVEKEVFLDITSNPTDDPFTMVNPNGPWSDIIGYEFQCKFCGQLFGLSVNVYHGIGGWWKPQNPRNN